MQLDFEHTANGDTVGEAHLTDTGVDQVSLDTIHVVEGERGNGYGSALLASVCAAADAEGVTITLTAEPTVDSPFSAKSLCKWFGRNHWISDPEDLYLMTRAPQVP